MAKIRAYFKVDLYFFEHPKVVDLSSDAIVLFLASVAYCNRRETDGFIAAPVLRRLMDFEPHSDGYGSIDDVAHELVKAELWELVEGGWQIHDFLDHNDSSQDREDRRTEDAARKRRARAEAKERPDRPDPPSGGTSKHVRTDNSGRPDGQERPSERVHDIAVTEQSDSTSREINTVVEQARPIDDITHVFRTWQEVTRKHRAQLDPKRRRRIKAALAQYPLQDVLDAVQGWQHSPHHCGQNNTGTVYNDLDLLLRDAEHLERFRDLWRDGPPPVVSKQTAQAMRTSAAMRARAEGVMDRDLRRVGRPGGPAQRGLPQTAD